MDCTLFKTAFNLPPLQIPLCQRMLRLRPEAKSEVTDCEDKVDSVKDDSGIGLPMVNELESTLEWT
jgi:hypothetical protein